jgi:endonuclease YncB( thermonuclease family)
VAGAAITQQAHAAGCEFDLQGEGRVAAILDATTFRMDDGQEVRLAGVVAPDAAGGKTNAQLPLAALIEHQDVELRAQSDMPDRYGRQIAFVFLTGSKVSVQNELLSRGEAVASATVTDRDCAADLSAAERTARQAKLGFWGEPSAIKNAESPGDILARIGLFTMVEGTVISARELGAISYINFGRRWTRDFVVTISKRMMPSFEAAGLSLKSLQNRRVRIRGWVEERGGPRIEASRVGQIELSDDQNTVAGK